MSRTARAVVVVPSSQKKIDPAAARAHLRALTSAVESREKITSKLEHAGEPEKDRGVPNSERAPA